MGTPGMTVEELISYLQKLPKDTVIGVVYRACSDYVLLEERELEFVSAEGIKEYYQEAKRYVLRHGKVMEYNPTTWDSSEVPQFVPILLFPGN